MKSRNKNVQVVSTYKEILNNTLVYIPILLLMIYAGNKYYGIELLKGLSSLIPTVTAIFITTVLANNILKTNHQRKEAVVTSFVVGVSIATLLQALMFIFAFNLQFNILTIILNILLSGAGSAFFTVYDYKNVYREEYRNIFVTLVSILTIVFFSLLKLSFDLTLSLGLFTSVLILFFIFNYKNKLDIQLSLSNTRVMIKEIFNTKNIKNTPEYYIEVLPAFLILYIVLYSNGFVEAGMATLMLILASILFIIWSAVKRNLILDKHSYVTSNTSNFRKGLSVVLLFTVIITSVLIIFSQQILSLFMIPIEYGYYFITISLTLLPIMLSLIITTIFNDVRLIKNQPLETTATITIVFASFLLIPYVTLSSAIFIAYNVYIIWLLIKTSNFKGQNI